MKPPLPALNRAFAVGLLPKGRVPLPVRCETSACLKRLVPSMPWLSALWLLIVAAVAIPLQAAQFGDFEYELSDGQITITGYTGPGGDVASPESIGGLPVTVVENRAFNSCVSLTSVIIPAGKFHGFRNTGESELHVRAVLAAPIFEASYDDRAELTRRWVP